MVYALQQLGNPVYGFGMFEKGDKIPCYALSYRIQKKRRAENRARVTQEAELARSNESEEDYERERLERFRRVDEAVNEMRRGAR